MTAVTDQDHTDNDHMDNDHTDHDQTDSGRIDNDHKNSKSSKSSKSSSSGTGDNPEAGEREQVRAQDRVGAEDGGTAERSVKVPAKLPVRNSAKEPRGQEAAVHARVSDADGITAPRTAAGTGPHAPSRREPRSEPGTEPGTELGTDPGADAGAEPGAEPNTDSAEAWDDGLIARRVSEASAAEQAAVMETRIGGGGGSSLPSTPLTYDAPCGPGSTRCVNSWGSPAPGSTAGPSPRPAGCSTRRRPGAGSPGSTPSSPSRAPPGAASRSCSTPSPE